MPRPGVSRSDSVLRVPKLTSFVSSSLSRSSETEATISSTRGSASGFGACAFRNAGTINTDNSNSLTLITHSSTASLRQPYLTALGRTPPRRLRVHKLPSLQEQIAHCVGVDFLQAHEDARVVLIMRLQVIHVRLRVEQLIALGKINANHQRIRLRRLVRRNARQQLSVEFERGRSVRGALFDIGQRHAHFFD